MLHPAEEETKKELYSKSNHQLVDLILTMRTEIDSRDTHIRTLHIKLWLALMALSMFGLLLIYQNAPQ